MIPRKLSEELREYASAFRSVGIIGPRQTGKSTLARLTFPEFTYLSFENPSVEGEFLHDPAQFLKKHSRDVIFDEAQRVPEIFRYLQSILDQTDEPGRIVITGSSSLLLQSRISQSLAGRIGYLELLPLSLAELRDAQLTKQDVSQHIFTGGYPEIWKRKLSPAAWAQNYIMTYVQRDVRMFRNIQNINAFDRFLRLCAGYAGQLVNKDALGRGAGVDAKTADAWLSLLEASYIIFLLPPYHENFNKRVIRSPKLYFYDTALLCHLLGLTQARRVAESPAFGRLFENWIITEIRKNLLNQALAPDMFFFRDSAGNEVDLIIMKDGEPLAIEIKSANRLNTEMFRGLRYWLKTARVGRGLLIYNGPPSESPLHEADVLPWYDVADV